MSERITPFRKAILEALTELEITGEKINQAVIIKNAKFSDGRSVGETTLYRKNTAGEFVHQYLLTKIKEAMELQHKQKGLPTKTETISSLKLQITKLNDELSSLFDQVVQQEQLLNKLQTGINVDSHIEKAQETEIYVLSALVKRLAPASSNAAKHSADFVHKYEQKNRGYNIIEGANLEIKEYIKDIKYSTLFSFSGSNKHIK
jgi:hypothetical protein